MLFFFVICSVIRPSLLLTHSFLCGFFFFFFLFFGYYLSYDRNKKRATNFHDCYKSLRKKEHGQENYMDLHIVCVNL